jgi:hypothetical protein
MQCILHTNHFFFFQSINADDIWASHRNKKNNLKNIYFYSGFYEETAAKEFIKNRCKRWFL